MLTNLNRQKDFTPYQSPPFLCWIFFLQVCSYPGLSIFLGLQPCGVRWEGLLSVPHLRTFHPAGRVVCLYVFCFLFVCTTVSLWTNLTPDCMNQKHSQYKGFLGLGWRMYRPVCSRVGGAVWHRKIPEENFLDVLLWNSICFSVGWFEAIACCTWIIFQHALALMMQIRD